MEHLFDLVINSDDSKQTCDIIENHIEKHNLQPIPSRILLYLSRSSLNTLKVLMKYGVDINESISDHSFCCGSFTWFTMITTPCPDSKLAILDYLIENGGRFDGTFQIENEEMDVFDYLDYWIKTIPHNDLEYRTSILNEIIKRIIDQLTKELATDPNLKRKCLEILVDLKSVDTIEYLMSAVL